MKVDGKNYVIHKRDVKIDKDKLKKILDSRDMEYTELWESICDIYGEKSIEISYKAFMNLLSNRNTWKLIYAMALTDVLKIGIADVFDIVEIDVNKAIEKRKILESRYPYKKRTP